MSSDEKSANNDNRNGGLNLVVVIPAALLVEGYGKLKTSVINMKMPSGATTIMESNGFDACATFFHPASKYAVPGTDATIGRDIVLTAFPPAFKSEASASTIS